MNASASIDDPPYDTNGNVIPFAGRRLRLTAILMTRLLVQLIGERLLIQLVLPRELTFSQLFNMASFVIAVSLPFNFLQYIPQLTKFFSGPAGALIAFVYLVLAISSQPRVEPKE